MDSVHSRGVHCGLHFSPRPVGMWQREVMQQSIVKEQGKTNACLLGLGLGQNVFNGLVFMISY